MNCLNSDCQKELTNFELMRLTSKIRYNLCRKCRGNFSLCYNLMMLKCRVCSKSFAQKGSMLKTICDTCHWKQRGWSC